MSEPAHQPESSNPPPNSGSAVPNWEGNSLTPNIAAGLACLFSIVGGIIFLILEKRNRFVRLWAMQSAFLGGLAIAVSVVFKIAYLVFGLLPLVGRLMVILFTLLHLLFALAWFAVYVITVVKAFSNQTWEIPWLGMLAAKQLDRQDADPPPSV